MGPLDAIFKAYDIRAIVPDQLDAELARKIGSAFAAFAKSPKILIGNDMRPSGGISSGIFRRRHLDGGGRGPARSRLH